jgi:phage-related tail protein
MSRAPSDKTQLATAKREIKHLTQELRAARESLTHYRGRATSAEQSVAEWKARFDKLLEFRKALSIVE